MAFDRNFVAGAFNVLWDNAGTPIDLGYTESGFEWTIDVAENVPIQEDRHGMAIIDAVIQNIRSMYIRLESLYWNEAIWGSVLPHLTQLPGSGNADIFTLPTAGELVVRSSNAKELLLTPKTGVAIVAGAPNYVFKFYNAFPVDPVTLMMSARELRRVPMNFQIFPTIPDNDDTVEAKWFNAAVTTT